MRLFSGVLGLGSADMRILHVGGREYGLSDPTVIKLSLEIDHCKANILCEYTTGGEEVESMF